MSTISLQLTAVSPRPVVSPGSRVAAPSPPSLDPQAIAPPGWTPRNITPVPSALKPGFVGGFVDAIRGTTEPRPGQPLSLVQVGALSPLLAKEWGLPVTTVAKDLKGIGIFTGGPPADRASYAVTLGKNIYVKGEDDIKRMLSWDGRRWLTHELGHTMQWRRAANDQGNTDRDRLLRFAGQYVGALPKAVPVGIAKWANNNFNPINRDKKPISIEKAIHDSHSLEHEAEVKARNLLGMPPQV